MMHISTLRVFSDLAETKNFSKTAKINHVSQSAISQKIKNLEKELQTCLIEKNCKFFQLTEKGKILQKYAIQILVEYNKMLKSLKTSENNRTEDLHILATYWSGLYVLPSYLRDFLRLFKKNSISIDYFDHSLAISQDKNENIIISENPIFEANFVSQPFAQSEIIVVGSAQSSFAQKQTFNITDIENYPIIGFSPGNAIRIIVENELKKRSIDIQYTAEFNNIELIKQCVENGNGIAFLPKNSIREGKEQHTFHRLQMDNCKINIPVFFSYNQEKYSTIMESFTRILRGENFTLCAH